MKIKDSVLVKHLESKASDLMIGIEVDLPTRMILLSADWVDTGLISWFIEKNMLYFINASFEKMDGPVFNNLNSFTIEFLVANKVKFHVQQVSEGFTGDTTLVLKLKV
ncbi:MAG: hypothetical protein H7Z73_05395 [Candidatus Saccharibacteria bacterium]|nr:hypothetical protein [Moraxellaceae bacterium]